MSVRARGPRAVFPSKTESQSEPGTVTRARRHQSQGPSTDPDAPAAKKQKTKQTILFKDANAENKDWKVEEIYKIIEYPIRSNQWYIIRCQQCGLVFATVHGAAKHLSGSTHGSDGRWDRAVEWLGVRVVDCNEEDARRNNAAFEEACIQGHHPKTRREDVSRTSPASNAICDNKSNPDHGQRDMECSFMEYDTDPNDFDYVPSDDGASESTLEIERQIAPFLGIAEPMTGEIYQAYRGEDEAWYLVTVLPVGEFQEIGMAGHLKDTNLDSKIPFCYETNQDGLHIVGWRDGFEASGCRVFEREFPCLIFDEEFEVPHTGLFVLPRGRRYAWRSAKDLRDVVYRQPGGYNTKHVGRIAASNFRERVVAMKDASIAAQPEADMFGQSSNLRPGNQTHGHAASSGSSDIRSTLVVHQSIQGARNPARSLEPDHPTGQGQQRTSNRLRSGPRALYEAPPGKTEQKEKVYCDNWIRTGRCKFARTLKGCKFKHEIPDSKTRKDPGLEEGGLSRTLFPALRPGSQRWTPRG